jgi:hypothetical protein
MLRTGETCRIKFTVPSGLTPDVLFTIVGRPSGPGSPIVSMRLYDGAILLGAQENLRDTVAFWKSPDSLFGTPGSLHEINSTAVVVNFSSIVSGTIDGRLELSVTSGTISLFDLDLSLVELWRPRETGGTIATPAVMTAREVCR